MKRISALLLALLLTGCESFSYYMQAVGEHMDLRTRARPIGELLVDPQTPKDLRERLAFAQSVREFATKDLGLPDNGSYRSYADLDRPYAVWNVVIAGPFSLDAVESCFPVAGCVTYRGYYSREDAQRDAEQARERGLDAFVYGVPAYSTLGMFDDPLLSTFIRWGDAEIARLVFHELAHQLVYVKGDTAFNESFAVAVEREGVRRWLASAGRSSELAKFQQSREREREFARLLDETRTRLAALYKMQIPREEMRARKQAEFERLAAEPVYKRHAGGYVGGPNNALLAAFSSYSQLVPAFERTLGESNGDLNVFYSKVKALAKLEKAERTRVLEAQVRGISTTLR